MATMNYDKIELTADEKNWLIANPGIYPDDNVEIRMWEGGSKKRIYVTIGKKNSWLDLEDGSDMTLELRHDVNPAFINWLERAQNGQAQSLAQKQNKGAAELQQWSKSIGSRLAKLAMVLDASIDAKAASKAAQELIHPSTLDYIDGGYSEKVRGILWNEDKWAIDFLRHHNDRQAKGGGIASFNANEQGKLKEFAKRLEALIVAHERQIPQPYNHDEPIYGADFEEDNEPIDYNWVRFQSLLQSVQGWNGLEAGDVQIWQNASGGYEMLSGEFSEYYSAQNIIDAMILLNPDPSAWQEIKEADNADR